MERSGIRVTAPSLSIVMTIYATTFFGAAAGDRVFLSLAFQRHSSSHFSSFFHPSHLSFELADSIFWHLFITYQQHLFGVFLVWVATPFFIFSQTRSLPHICLLVTSWILESVLLFKWRLHFFHLLIFLSKELVLSSI